MLNYKQIALSSAIAITLNQSALIAAPMAQIQTDNQSLQLGLQTGNQTNTEADWWLLANNKGKWYHYNTNGQWSNGMSTTHQGPLVDIENMTVSNLSGLPAGENTLYFGVDTQKNGQIDEHLAFYGSTSINVENTDSISSESSTSEGVLCDYSNNTFNHSPSVNMSSSAIWSCTESTRELSANGIPDHETGTFPNASNPNTISEQSVSISFPLQPVQTGTRTDMGGPRGAAGYVLNGVKIDADTAGSCDDSGNSCSMIGNTGTWSIEALGQEIFDFGDDENHAHVQPNGSYHYHGIPEGFLDLQGANSSTMTLIGWAADGFPIYARYGYSDANDNNSDLKVISGSYELVSNVSSSRPSVDIYPLGTFSQDWEYVSGLGDLDQCNGRFGVTPEFPDGIYHYYATDSYPYFQRCVTGQVDSSGIGQSQSGPGGNGYPPSESGNFGQPPSGTENSGQAPSGPEGNGYPPSGPGGFGQPPSGGPR